MMRLNFKHALFAALTAAVMVSGCSDSGGGGSHTKDATIDSGNAKGLVLSGVGAIDANKSSNEAITTLPFIVPSAKGTIQELGERLPSMASMDLSTEYCTGGGTLTATANNNNTSASFTMSDCVVADGTVLDGTMSFDTVLNNDNQLVSISYSIDLDVTSGGLSESYNGSQTCTYATPGDYTTLSCTTDVSFTDSEGSHVEVADLSIEGDDYSGYSASGTINHSDYGTITFETGDPLVYGACDHPSSGSLSVSDGDGNSASFTALSCSDYQVCYTLAGGSTLCDSYTW